MADNKKNIGNQEESEKTAEKRGLKIFLAVLSFVILIIAVIYGRRFYTGISPAFFPPPKDIAGNVASDNLGLKLPPGFSISVFAQNLPGARVMVKDVLGNMWVSQTSEGTVSLLEIDKETGKVVNQGPIFRDLNKPHGLAINPENPFLLYIAEEDGIFAAPVYSEYDIRKIVDLPLSAGGHFTRTIGFGPDGKLYVSAGSSCNVCDENDYRRAKIFSMNADGSDFSEFSKGLRNTVFFTWHPKTGDMWGTDMGRDFLGDDLPPDEINIIKKGNNYGWPICFGKNVHDGNFDKNVYFRNPCMEPFETGSYIDIPAHSAPLGLAFVPEQGWPKDYQNNLMVAYHGSWNRSVPTGYKIVRIKLDADGGFGGEKPEIEDFITGWLTPQGALGRPVGILIEPDGVMYVSDDKAGVIYKVVADK